MTTPTLIDVNEGVVYYLRRGDRIKIGQTVRFVARRREHQVKEFAAVEPGGRGVEMARHAEFAHLNTDPQQVNNEWFRAEPELLAHIEHLRRVYVLPALPDYVSLAERRRRRDAVSAEKEVARIAGVSRRLQQRLAGISRSLPTG